MYFHNYYIFIRFYIFMNLPPLHPLSRGRTGVRLKGLMHFCIFFLFNRADDDHHFRSERYRSFQPTASGLRLDRQICRSS